MNARAKLLFMFLTCLLLSSMTWHFLGPQRQPSVQLSPPQPLELSPSSPTQRITREQLVGKWRLVSIDNTNLPGYQELTIDFSPDGKLIICHIISGEAPRLAKGTYEISGEMIFLTCPTLAEEGEPVRTRGVLIKNLSETELITVQGDGSEQSVYKRVANN